MRPGTSSRSWACVMTATASSTRRRRPSWWSTGRNRQGPTRRGGYRVTMNVVVRDSAPDAPKGRTGAGPTLRNAHVVRSALDLASDESVDRLLRVVVVVLDRRRLHEIRAGRKDRAADAAILGDLGGPDRVDDDAGRVRRVPHLELELGIERSVAEAAALPTDVRPFAVVQPRHVVGRADVHVALDHLVRDLARHRLRLGDLLGDQPGALQHVHEVHV